MIRTAKAYYKILQIEPQASQEVIDASYRRLARLYHPDLNPGKDSTRQMQELNEAYSILRDPHKRSEYDQYLADQAQPKSNSSFTSNDSFNGGKPAPTTCQKCGRSDATLRFATFPYVISFLFITFRRANSGLYCYDCRRQEMESAKTLTFLLGWWGFPWGIFYTLGALFAPGDGVIDANLNASYLRWLGAHFIRTGNLGQAKQAIKASLNLNYDPQLAKAANSMFNSRTKSNPGK